MSLVSTLGKVAMGVLVAKGVGKMTGGGAGGSAGGMGGGLGGLLGSVLGGAGASAGGTQRAPGSGSSGGGLGGLGALLGGRSGGSGASAGGLGGLLEAISGGGSAGAADRSQKPAAGSLGGLLNSALQGDKVPEPEPAQEAHARILIQAMVNAAKSDGNIDQDEQQKIVSHLGDDVTEEERQFVIGEMQAPLDLDGFVASVPAGAEQQVYMMSLMGIELDHPEEAKYLDQLRRGMNLTEQQCDAIHQQLGVGTLYS